jgi:hypothetical protein
LEVGLNLADKKGVVPLRGGNWNNASNAGMAALNLNNRRSNSNSNIGFRPALPHIDAKESRLFSQFEEKGNYSCLI